MSCADLLHDGDLVLHALPLGRPAGPNVGGHAARVGVQVIVIELRVIRIVRDRRRAPGYGGECGLIAHLERRRRCISGHAAAFALLDALHVFRDNGVGVRCFVPEKGQGLFDLIEIFLIADDLDFGTIDARVEYAAVGIVKRIEKIDNGGACRKARGQCG